MIQNALQSLGGIQGYGIVSLCLFFAVFTAALAWALTRQKARLDEMARLPLEENEQHRNPKDSQ
jgi:cbb3-type cytochrome oxidase subunit 3